MTEATTLREQYPEWPMDSVVSLMERLPNGTELALAIYQESKPAFLGLSRQGDSLIVVNNADRVYEIGSISKVFTAAILAQAVTENKVKLEESIWPLLALEQTPETVITLKQLANHTSGMPRVPSNMMLYAVTHPNNPYKEYSPEKLRTYLTDKLTLDEDPGTKYAYSNLGAGLLGYTMTQAYDQSYEALLREKITVPFGMQQTTTDITQVEDQIISGLKPNGSAAQHWEFTDALIGAGGILSTARDLTRFLATQLAQENAYITLQQQSTFSVSDNMDLALGWHILYQDDGAAWHWHNGGTGGYRSSMTIDTAQQTAALVLSNVSAGFTASSGVDQLNYMLMRHMEAPANE